MIRVLVSDPGSGRRSKLRHVVDVLVGELGARNYGVSCVGAPEDLATAFNRVRKGFYDIVVCRIDDECAQRTFEALERVREQDQDVSIVVVAEKPDFARDALDVGTEGYSLLEGGSAGLAKILEKPVGKAIARRSSTIGLKTDRGVGNIVVDDILFAESSKKGAVIHLPSDNTMLVRGSLQSLFETLSTTDGFIKAGNSFILNLGNIRSVGDKSVIFANGESVIVPVRSRTPVKDAFRAYCTKAS